MVDRVAPRAADPPSVRRYPFRRQGHIQRCSEATATDRPAPWRSAIAPAAQQRPLSDAEIVGGRVDEEVAHPHPSQIRMCRFPASGSSWESLARGGADDTIRDLPAKKDSR